MKKEPNPTTTALRIDIADYKEMRDAIKDHRPDDPGPIDGPLDAGVDLAMRFVDVGLPHSMAAAFAVSTVPAKFKFHTHGEKIWITVVFTLHADGSFDTEMLPERYVKGETRPTFEMVVDSSPEKSQQKEDQS